MSEYYISDKKIIDKLKDYKREPLTTDIWNEFLDNMLVRKLSKYCSSKVRQQKAWKKGEKCEDIYYFGVPEEEAVLSFELNLIKDHYFLEERTEITTDYIRRKFLYKEDIPKEYESYRFDKRNGKWYKNSDPEHFLMSGRLIKLLLAIDEVYGELIESVKGKLTPSSTFTIIHKGKVYSSIAEDLPQLKEDVSQN